MCSKHTERSRERRHPPFHALLHDWNRQCNGTGGGVPSLYPPLSDLWTLRIRWGISVRGEKWVGRECEEERGGGVVGLAASASRGTGLEPPWPALLLSGTAAARTFDFHSNASQDHVSQDTEIL